MRIDARTLGVTHLKAISRVYGDHGAEMLEVNKSKKHPKHTTAASHAYH